MRKNKIYIGIGHGGKDSGAVGQNGELEKDKALEIGLKVFNILKSLGYKTMISRQSDITFNTTSKVNAAERNNCNLLIDIHLNAFNKSALGTEIYYPHKSARGKILASEMCKNICNDIGTKNRGAKIRLNGNTDYYGVTRFKNGVGLLVEVCFIDNISDMQKFNSDDIAAAISYSIVKYYD